MRMRTQPTYVAHVHLRLRAIYTRASTHTYGYVHLQMSSERDILRLAGVRVR
jgi:hypothetical protein